MELFGRKVFKGHSREKRYKEILSQGYHKKDLIVSIKEILGNGFEFLRLKKFDRIRTSACKWFIRRST